MLKIRIKWMTVAWLAVFAHGFVNADVLTTSTGYRLEYFDSGAEPKGAWALIFMHGKNVDPAVYQNLTPASSQRFTHRANERKWIKNAWVLRC